MRSVPGNTLNCPPHHNTHTMNTEPKYYFETTKKGIDRLRAWCDSFISDYSAKKEDIFFAKSILSVINEVDITRRYQEGDTVIGKDYNGRPFKYTGVTGTLIAPELDSSTLLIRWHTQPNPTIMHAHIANIRLLQAPPRFAYRTSRNFTTVYDTTSSATVYATIRNTVPNAEQKAQNLCQELNNNKA